VERRSFLQGAGIVTVFVAGGVVWRAHDRGVFSVGEGPAYEPWKNWQESSAAGPMALVRAAILAASPHNTQPWIFKVAPAWIELYVDTGRNTGALDPYLREEHIGMGCALENLLQAAAANGYAATLALVPGKLTPTPSERAQKLLARVELAGGKRQASELYAAIPQRHTNRGTYDIHKLVPGGFTDELRALPADDANVKIFLFIDETQRKKIAAMSSAANDEIYADPVVAAGSQRWFRMTWSAVQKYRDGLTLDAAGLPPVATAVVKIVPRRVLNWLASRQSKDAYVQLMLSAPLIGIIAVRDRYDQEDCMRAGRLWQRAHLLATARGLAARPCNEAVEMIDYEKTRGKPAQRAAMLAEVLGDASWQPTFLFYVGYPLIAAHASPRRPINWVAVEVKA
jgi:nitroreductase